MAIAGVTGLNVPIDRLYQTPGSSNLSGPETRPFKIDSPEGDTATISREGMTLATSEMENTGSIGPSGGTTTAGLRVGQPNDQNEQEADRLADRVMSRTTAPSTPQAASLQLNTPSIPKPPPGGFNPGTLFDLQA
ncbi:MAG: hypothetical protein GY757_26060 [bacterium]|nr:hypothetical protein [bacterium]